ncbi:MAG TPA: ABC transporter permease subunit [Anaeromyxobacteraceae bacterium]|nr:ABC transporter permease subunit [Anaeromyxobacteraceae bacterium]
MGIARKELAVYFTTPVAWVVLMVVAFFSAQFFAGALDGFRYLATRALQLPSSGVLDRMNLTDMVVARLFGSVALFLLITSPFLTMRLLAEERRSSTFELLLTTPLRPVEIVMGKYLAALAVLLASLAIVAAYPALLALVGRGAQGGSAVEWPTVATGLLGLFLLGGMALAVGLCFSAFTDAPVVAALLSLIVLLGLWVATLFTITADGPVRDLAEALSASEHLGSFLQGQIALKDVLYYLSFTALGLFLAERAVEGRRWA